jgi:two-component system nitrogen regulation sensor histidine kinase NtrY
MGGKGKISANIILGADMAIIEVSDSGPGIEESLRERVFQPYFSTKKSGTGLGLAIADRIIVEHEGHIRVGDAPRGALFIIEIPLREGGYQPLPNRRLESFK